MSLRRDQKTWIIALTGDNLLMCGHMKKVADSYSSCQPAIALYRFPGHSCKHTPVILPAGIWLEQQL